MTYQLLPIPLSQLRELSIPIAPTTLGFDVEGEALPPAFVAAASLELIEGQGGPAWCSTYYILRCSDMRIVGSGCFKRTPYLNSVEIGYGIVPTARNSGAATQAVKDFVSLAFRNGLVCVTAEVTPENLASIKVLEKAGFSCVGSRVDDEDGLVQQWAVAKDASAR